MEVFAIVSKVDACQHHFSIALGSQFPDFIHRIFLEAGFQLSPGVGDNAEGAVIVAAFLDLHKGPGPDFAGHVDGHVFKVIHFHNVHGLIERLPVSAAHGFFYIVHNMGAVLDAYNHVHVSHLFKYLRRHWHSSRLRR